MTSELVEEAEQLGLSLPEYTLRLLFLRPPLQSRPQTGAELVAYWQDAGLIGAWPDKQE